MPVPFVSEPHAVPFVILYVGPDQILPLTSFLGAAVGIALMFWNRLINLGRRSWALLRNRGGAAGTSDPPPLASTTYNASPEAE